MKFRSFFPCVLTAILAPSLLAAGNPTEQYFALYMGGGKIGYAAEIRTIEGEKVSTAQNMEMTIGRGGTAITAKVSETSIETADGKPLGFEFVQDMVMAASKSSGKVQNGKLIVTTDNAGQKSTQTIDFPPGTLMAEGIRLASIKHGLKAGTAWKATIFTASIMEPMPISFLVGEVNDVDLLGRVVRLTKVTSTMNASSGPMVQTAWVDNECRTMKMTTSAMGMTMEMVACPKEFAMAEGDVVEFFDRVTVKSPEPLPSMDGVKSITYHISPNAGSKPVFPTTDTQKVTTSPDGSILLTVTRQVTPAADTIPPTIPSTLIRLKEPTQYVESNDPCVVSLAKQAVGSERDAWKAAKKIEKFCSTYVADKNLSVGYASAAEVARSRSGDCTEHAVLVAAMCRAVGLPARVTAGLVYAAAFGDQENIFGPHAWAEVNIGGKWYGLDATDARGYAPDHIAIASGDGSPAAFLGIANTVGNFTISKLDIQR